MGEKILINFQYGASWRLCVPLDFSRRIYPALVLVIDEGRKLAQPQPEIHDQ